MHFLKHQKNLTRFLGAEPNHDEARSAPSDDGVAVVLHDAAAAQARHARHRARFVRHHRSDWSDQSINLIDLIDQIKSILLSIHLSIKSNQANGRRVRSTRRRATRAPSSVPRASSSTTSAMVRMRRHRVGPGRAAASRPSNGWWNLEEFRL